MHSFTPQVVWFLVVLLYKAVSVAAAVDGGGVPGKRWGHYFTVSSAHAVRSLQEICQILFFAEYLEEGGKRRWIPWWWALTTMSGRKMKFLSTFDKAVYTLVNKVFS